MNLVKKIIENSAIGPLSNTHKSIVLSLFASIVITLVFMLATLLSRGSSMNIEFGY